MTGYTPQRCKECWPGGRQRPAPYPGPRCATHHRLAEKSAKARRHDAYVAKTYGVTRGFYDRLLEAQDGKCAICQRANGRTKRLAVDHDHRDDSVRGILCGPCNQMLGHCRDDPAMLRRAVQYLREPPAAPLLIASEEETA